MKNLLISGIFGTVGKEVFSLSAERGYDSVCGVDKTSFLNADCPVYTSFSEVKENVDVIVDFSSSALTEKAAEFALDYGCKMVCGTTALSDSARRSLELLSQKNAVFYSANFSRAVYSFMAAAQQLRKSLEGFDTEIIEEHNRLKKDAPSGTAKALSEKINCQQILSVRGGNIAGKHQVVFLGQNEEIELTHRAYNKIIFASGALDAVDFIISKDKGYFTMDDLMKKE